MSEELYDKKDFLLEFMSDKSWERYSCDYYDLDDDTLAELQAEAEEEYADQMYEAQMSALDYEGVEENGMAQH